MPTQRCPQCGRALRDDACSDPDCGYVGVERLPTEQNARNKWGLAACRRTLEDASNGGGS